MERGEKAGEQRLGSGIKVKSDYIKKAGDRREGVTATPREDRKNVVGQSEG